jgi:hypothetical protein
MEQTYLERIALALEQIALELVAERAIPTTATVTVPTPEPRTSYNSPAMPTASFPAIGWTCPEHGGSKVVPAGVSKRTGRPYSAFVACPAPGCDRKPEPVAPRADPPSQLP